MQLFFEKKYNVKVSTRFLLVCQDEIFFFHSVFFFEPRYDVRDAKKHSHVTQNPRTRKTSRVDSKIPE